jgi:hypothetical protein
VKDCCCDERDRKGGGEEKLGRGMMWKRGSSSTSEAVRRVRRSRIYGKQIKELK